MTKNLPDEQMTAAARKQQSQKNLPLKMSPNLWRTDSSRISVGARDDEPDIVEKELEEEVERVKELGLSVMEREQRLQLRLAELRKLREEEAKVRKLDVTTVEAQLLELKSASVLAVEENWRLEAQATI
ncbi:hypothetical protein E2562_013690 [Oryza meyeriana var. granulata]|uniref:Uncharacterized protein n=1 Tax=Oryza meyeriana var. granulata TaxID=110450 RepID=A0A6G1BIS4_9ORYZ|nr:hypothetical protein E2562_013690 [Oryza meyeriana var. granulata]